MRCAARHRPCTRGSQPVGQPSSRGRQWRYDRAGSRRLSRSQGVTNLLAAAAHSPGVLGGSVQRGLELAVRAYQVNLARRELVRVPRDTPAVTRSPRSVGNKRTAFEQPGHGGLGRGGHRHPHRPLPASERPVGRDLAAAAQPGRSGLTRHLATTCTQTIKIRANYPPVTYLRVPTPEDCWFGSCGTGRSSD
jgi:hypothetical protein